MLTLYFLYACPRMSGRPRDLHQAQALSLLSLSADGAVMFARLVFARLVNEGKE